MSEEEILIKVLEFIRRINSAESIEEHLQIQNELIYYLEGVVDSEPVPLAKGIGNIFIMNLRLSGMFLRTFDNLFNRLINLESRLKRIEDEWEIREKYK